MRYSEFSPEIKKVLYERFGIRIIDGLNIFHSYLENLDYVLSDDLIEFVIKYKKVKNRKDLERFLQSLNLGYKDFLKSGF